MAASLTLSIVEIIVLLFGAIILGITIHFFIASRKTFKTPGEETPRNSLAKDEWKLKYFNDIEFRDKEITELKSRLQESEESVSISTMEAEEMHHNYKTVKAELDKLKKSQSAPPADQSLVEDLRRQIKQLQEEQNNIQVSHSSFDNSHHPKASDYIEQLREAQHSLIEQNQKINQLLGNIDVIKQQEEMQQLMLRSNEELNAQLERMREQLEIKEQEIHSSRQKENLTKEMSSMLDHAYNDFNILKDKIQKLESQLTSSKMTSMEFEDLKEAHSKINLDNEEFRMRNNILVSENQELKLQLTAAEEQLRESNFQRVQLQKKVSYLEDLNNDLQEVSDANKKLEGRLKRIGELESMLNMAEEERDLLIGKTPEA